MMQEDERTRLKLSWRPGVGNARSLVWVLAALGSLVTLAIRCLAGGPPPPQQPLHRPDNDAQRQGPL